MDYFAANDLAAFNIVAGSPTEATTAGYFDAAYTTKYIWPTTGAIVESAAFVNPSTGAVTSLTDLWFHFDYRCGITSINGSLVTLYNSVGVAVLRVTWPTSSTTRVDYWNGSTWVTSGPVSSLPGDTNLHTYDIHIVCGAAGSVNLIIDQTDQFTMSGLNAAVTDVQSFQLGRAGTTGNLFGWSQVLVSDTSTVGAKVASAVPNSNGTHTAWAGDYTNIVKNGYDDSTMISSSTLADMESYGATDVTLPANYSISSAWYAIRAKLNTSSPANITPLMVVGGTDYTKSYNFQGLSSTAYAPALAAFETDPSTGAAWSATSFNASEIGFKTAS